MSRTSRSVPTLALAALLAGFTLTGCSDSRSGAAAVVAGDRIEISSLNARVEQAADVRAQFGVQPESGVSASRTQLSRMVEQRVTKEAAERAGIAVTATEIADWKRGWAAQNPGVSLPARAAMEGIAAGELDGYLRTKILQSKLVAAEGVREGSPAFLETRDRILSETAESIKIIINPRYGSAWSPRGADGGRLDPTDYAWLTPDRIA